MAPAVVLDSDRPSCLARPDGTVVVGVDEGDAVAAAAVAAVADRPSEPFDCIPVQAAFDYNPLEAFDHPLEASDPAVEDTLAAVEASVVPALAVQGIVAAIGAVKHRQRAELHTDHRVVFAGPAYHRAAVAENRLAEVETVVQDGEAQPSVARSLQTADPWVPFDDHLFDHIRRALEPEA